MANDFNPTPECSSPKASRDDPGATVLMCHPVLYTHADSTSTCSAYPMATVPLSAGSRCTCESVRFAPARQVVRSDWRIRFDWDAMGLKRLGFFGIATTKLRVYNVAEGIFSLPNPKRSRAHYDEAIREMDILRRAGASFG